MRDDSAVLRSSTALTGCRQLVFGREHRVEMAWVRGGKSGPPGYSSTRVSHMAMGAQLDFPARQLRSPVMQRLHDPALRPGAIASCAQADQILLQGLQFGQALGHMRDVRCAIRALHSLPRSRLSGPDPGSAGS